MGFAQEKKLFWDGYDWQKIDEICRANPEYIHWIKSSYLCGMFDSKFFYKLKSFDIDPNLEKKLFEDQLEPSGNKAMIQGLDQFYKKIENKYIPIPLATIAVSMSQSGSTNTEINKFIHESKIWINKLIIQIEK